MGIHAKKKTSPCDHKKTAAKSQGDKREVKPITRKSQEKTSHAKKKTSRCDHKKTASKSQGDKREVKPITRKSQEKTIHAKKKTSRCDHKKTASKSQGDKRDKVLVSEYLTTLGETVGGAADDMLTGNAFKKMGSGISNILERITPDIAGKKKQQKARKTTK